MNTYDTYKKIGWATTRFSGLLVVVVLFLTFGFEDVNVPSWGLPVAAVLAFALAYVGFKTSKLVESWQWEDVGQEVGLTPVEDGHPRELSNDTSWFGKAPLSGRVRGRPVRARVHTDAVPGDQTVDTDTSSSVTFTVVETDLDRAADGGVIVNPVSGGFTDSAEEGPDAQNNELAAISDEKTHAEALIMGRAREALLQVDEIGHLFVGDAEAVFQEAIPDLDDLDTGMMPQSKSKADKRAHLRTASTHASGDIDHVGDEKTVTHRIKGTVLDPEKLERQMEAVVTAAEVYEEALKKDRPSS